jgi:hypothetical protein
MPLCVRFFVQPIWGEAVAPFGHLHSGFIPVFNYAPVTPVTCP